MLMNNHISFTIGIKGNISSVTRFNSQHRDTKQILQPTQEYFKNMFKPERIRKLPKLTTLARICMTLTGLSSPYLSL